MTRQVRTACVKTGGCIPVFEIAANESNPKKPATPTTAAAGSDPTAQNERL